MSCPGDIHVLPGQPLAEKETRCRPGATRVSGGMASYAGHGRAGGEVAGATATRGGACADHRPMVRTDAPRSGQLTRTTILSMASGSWRPLELARDGDYLSGVSWLRDDLVMRLDSHVRAT